MPSFKRGSRWHTDRLAERDRLVRKTDWLMSRARSLEGLL
jgi:hypothetical protein